MDSKDKKDWEELLTRLTREEAKTQPKAKANLFPAFLAFNIFVASTAVMLMLLNMVVNQAWPGLSLFRPGIGYRNAWFASVIGWVFTLLKTGVVGSVVKSIYHDRD